ncbi:glutamate ligase domain-containing protein [Spiroplasma alleghenense]|uniref:Folylpolyglutamate synthase n=1 Tax=Spiroplasma alleghenense TaxID=216931 RepID=A0A345Z2B7_9MOLU|nr:cyanophycin synthetase [Spiroplasma alleghenense]AXK50746.1 folylpolyglutamate synthase [Spiroplasma alleghenense]
MISVSENFIPKFQEASKKNLREILEKHKNFQNQYPVINVVGTNGKGSTSYFTSQGLKPYYSKIGLFISPAFLYQNERIQINNECISDSNFKKILKKFEKDINDNKLNFFEIYTLIAMWYFFENKVDIAVIEAGIGGVLDTTNLFENQIATVLTTVGLDHEEILGYNVKEIINQKIGIAKKGFVVISPDNKKYFKLIKYKLQKVDLPLFQSKIYYEDKTYQKNNKGLVLKLFEVLKLDFDLTIFNNQGLFGRLTVLNKSPKLIIDGAHNVKGIQALIKTSKIISKNFEVIFASSWKKNFHKEIKILRKNFKNIYFAEFNEIENWNFEKKYQVIDWKEKIKNNIKNNQDTLVCGSLYFVPIVYQWFITEG